MEYASAAEENAPPEKSVADIAEMVKPSLVKVIQVGRQGMAGLGSGFVVRADGLIATNRHVIGEARRIKVETSDGKVEEVTEMGESDFGAERRASSRGSFQLVRFAIVRQPLPHAFGILDAVQHGEPG